MKNPLTKIISALILALIVFVATTHQAQAIGFLDAMAMGPLDAINYILAALFNMGLTIMSWLLAIAGATLNFSINLTLNIKEFVDKAPAIYTTWRAIRDISGIFFIFYLLYSALQLILGLKGPKYAETLKNIVIAGVLINFSFFFAGLGIDASNIVSKQLYNAMTGGATSVAGSLSIDSAIGAGGISNIFMNSLKIQTLYSNTNTLSANSTTDKAGVVTAIKDPFKIVLIGIVGIIIEFVAAMSFFAAALAFIGRFVMLLFLLAFSPVLFLSFLPKVGEYTKKWISLYESMLLFMPVYLLLMYLALNVLTTTPMFGGKNASTDAITASAPASSGQTSIIENALAQATPSTNSGGDWYSGYLLLAVNATIVIFLLNMPLVAAASIAGKGSETLGGLLGGAVKKFGAGAVWKTVGSRIGTSSYQGTVGRAASKIAQTEGFKDLAARNSMVGKVAGWTLTGTRAVAGSYDKKLGEQVGRRTQFAESLGYDQEAVNTQLGNIRNVRAQIASGAITQAAGDVQIRAINNAITNIKNQRKFGYATRINTRSIDTVYMKRARKNKVAAAKIHVDVWEADLKDRKDDMKALRGEITNVQNQINAQPGGVATGPQGLALAGLQTRQTALQTTIDNLERQIGDAKLVK